MSSQALPRRPALATLRLLLKIAAPARGRLLLSIALGAGAAMSTVGLLASSGALIDRAALRPPLYTLTVLMAAVQLLALGRGPLRYVERLFSHDSALGAVGRLRLWLYDEIEPRSPAGLGEWRSGDLLSRATADVDTLQDLSLRGVSPVLIGLITSLFAVALVAVILPAAGLVLAVCLAGALGITSLVAWQRQHRLGAREAALKGRALRRRGRTAAGGTGPGGLRARRGVPGAGPWPTTRPSPVSARRRSWTAGAVSAVERLLHWSSSS